MSICANARAALHDAGGSEPRALTDLDILIDDAQRSDARGGRHARARCDHGRRMNTRFHGGFRIEKRRDTRIGEIRISIDKGRDGTVGGIGLCQHHGGGLGTRQQAAVPRVGEKTQ